MSPNVLELNLMMINTDIMPCNVTMTILLLSSILFYRFPLHFSCLLFSSHPLSFLFHPFYYVSPVPVPLPPLLIFAIIILLSFFHPIQYSLSSLLYLSSRLVPTVLTHFHYSYLLELFQISIHGFHQRKNGFRFQHGI